ncbi:MAG: VWA domain-containing protein, partial [Planctomycetota bacterium]
LTGVRLPPDARVWRAWWSARGEGPATEALPGPGVTAAFYELPVASSRVCFVIDRSLSMREGDRFEKARGELKRLLGALPEGSRVNILFFGAGVSSFAGGLRPLDAQARRDAADFVDRQVPDARGTDLHGALEKALLLVGNPDSGVLREEGADTIVLLSDGLPTVGRVVDEELLARVVARRARYLRPVFHAVRLGAEAPMLRRLTERTGGRFLLLR